MFPSCYKWKFKKEENLLTPKGKPTVLQEHVELLSLQSIDRNRDSACHKTFFKKEMPGMNPNLQNQRLVSQLHFFCISIMALKHLLTDDTTNIHPDQGPNNRDGPRG
jgi:hypothetical protein